MVNTHNAVFLSTIFGSKIISDEGVLWVVKNELDLLNSYSLFVLFGRSDLVGIVFQQGGKKLLGRGYAGGHIVGHGVDA